MLPYEKSLKYLWQPLHWVSMDLNVTGVLLSSSGGRSSPMSSSGHFCSMTHRLLNLWLLGNCHRSWRNVGKRKQYAGRFNRETGEWLTTNSTKSPRDLMMALQWKLLSSWQGNKKIRPGFVNQRSTFHPPISWQLTTLWYLVDMWPKGCTVQFLVSQTEQLMNYSWQSMSMTRIQKIIGTDQVEGKGLEIKGWKSQIKGVDWGSVVLLILVFS